MNTFFKFLTTLRKVALGLAVVGLLGGAGWGVWQWRGSGDAGPSYRTEKATRGRLVALISATGTVVPEEVVDVGAQVAGRIEKFGEDPDRSGKPIDYRSRVEKGTKLAYIDKALYEADVNSAKADLAVARADVDRARADVAVAEAKLTQTERDFERARRLGPGGAIAGSDFDLLRSAYESARATVPSAKANLARCEKTVERCQAALDRAQTNLDYCTIVSPVNGVVIDRRVNVGQTVVASLNAPSLFLIAKDLTKMQVWASVNEADIGRIQKGQPVYFKVDAYPQDVFAGEVSEIRLNASMTNNVVTYTVVITTNNQDLKLLPYLTANVQFRVDQRQDALLVPNAALRYRPAAERVAPEYRDAYEQTGRRKAVTTEMKPADKNKEARNTQGTVWVEGEDGLKPIEVTTGVTDGTMTEVVPAHAGEWADGADLITGEQQTKGASAGSNPFAPKMFGAKK
jgi:HlyD family secretion protein